MQPMSTIHNWQFGQLKNGVSTLEYIVQSVTPEAATTYRDNGEGWTVTEVMCHLRDYEALFIERAKLTLNQEMAELPNPDPDALAAESKYNEQDLQSVFNEWKTHRAEFITLLETIQDDQWERPAKHPRRGPFTLNDQVFLTVWHDLNHFEQIVRILTEKKV